MRDDSLAEVCARDARHATYPAVRQDPIHKVLDADTWHYISQEVTTSEDGLERAS